MTIPNVSLRIMFICILMTYFIWIKMLQVIKTFYYASSAMLSIQKKYRRILANVKSVSPTFQRFRNKIPMTVTIILYQMYQHIRQC